MQKSFLLLIILSAFLSGKAQSPDTVKSDPIVLINGDQLHLTPYGFPQQIQLSDSGDSLLAENIHFHFIRQSDGKDIRFKSEGTQFIKMTSQKLTWKSIAMSDELRMEVSATLEKGVLLIYSVQVEVLANIEVKDIVMHIPFRKEMAGAMSGLGKHYGVSTDSMFLWHWKGAGSGPEKIWIGTPKTGLQYTLAGGADWANEGKGGVGIGIKGKSMLANNFTGPRALKKGEFLYFVFNLSVTPPTQ